MKKDLKNKGNLTPQPTRVKLSTAQLRQLESERRRIVEALHQSETMLRKITEKSVVGVYLIQDDTFRYVNPKMAEIFGYTAHELIDNKGPERCCYGGGLAASSREFKETYFRRNGIRQLPFQRRQGSRKNHTHRGLRIQDGLRRQAGGYRHAHRYHSERWRLSEICRCSSIGSRRCTT